MQEGERPADGGLNPRYAQKKFLLPDETSASAEQDEADFVMERASRRLPSLDEPDLTSPIARSPLPEPDGLTVTSPIARSPRGRRPDVMAPLLEGIVVDSGSSILEKEGQLRCCLLRTFIDFARIVVKGRLEESLEYATEEASYRSLAPALLVAGLVMMMHPQAVLASILAQPRPLVIKNYCLVSLVVNKQI